MWVLCSVLLRGVGHIRQLYPWDNWPDRDAKQVRRHFEERARSQVRDTTNQLASPIWVPVPIATMSTVSFCTRKAIHIIFTLSHSIYLLRLCYTYSDTCTQAHTWHSGFFSDPFLIPLPWMQSSDRSTNIDPCQENSNFDESSSYKSIYIFRDQC